MGVLLAISRIIIASFLASSSLLYLYCKLQQNPRPRRTSDTRNEIMEVDAHSGPSNSSSFDALEWRRPILNNVLEALSNVDIHSVGVYGSNGEIRGTLFQRVCRRVYRDNLFDVVLIATVGTKRPDMMMIQNEIARQLLFVFTEKSVSKRADELIQRIKNERKVLIILYDVCKGFNLKKVGIPVGAHHRGCKILVSSESEKVLSNHIHAQKIFMV